MGIHILKYSHLIHTSTFTSMYWSTSLWLSCAGLLFCYLNKNITCRYFKSQSSTSVDFLVCHNNTNMGVKKLKEVECENSLQNTGHAQQVKKNPQKLLQLYSHIYSFLRVRKMNRHQQLDVIYPCKGKNLLQELYLNKVRLLST